MKLYTDIFYGDQPDGSRSRYGVWAAGEGNELWLRITCWHRDKKTVIHESQAKTRATLMRRIAKVKTDVIIKHMKQAAYGQHSNK